MTHPTFNEAMASSRVQSKNLRIASLPAESEGVGSNSEVTFTSGFQSKWDQLQNDDLS